MKTLSALMVGLSFSIAIPAAYLAPDHPASASVVECLSDRVAAVRDAATFLRERVALIRRSPNVNPSVVGALEGVDERLAELEGNMRNALAPPPSEGVLGRALVEAATRIAILRSTMTRINIGLLLSTDEAVKVAAREMATRLDEIGATVPADDPARGCGSSPRRR